MPKCMGENSEHQIPHTDQSGYSAHNNSTIPSISNYGRLHVCIFCGIAYPKSRSLTAHLRKHISSRDAAQVSFYAPRELYHRFEQLVKSQGSTVCHEFVSYMAARLAASQRAPIKYSPNPGFHWIQIHINHLHLHPTPRSKRKYQI